MITLSYDNNNNNNNADNASYKNRKNKPRSRPRNNHQQYNGSIGRQTQGFRLESDSIGNIEVPASHYWGAQTQRSLDRFSIGDDEMPKAVYHAYRYIIIFSVSFIYNQIV
jgi:hypothetical protein